MFDPRIELQIWKNSQIDCVAVLVLTAKTTGIMQNQVCTSCDTVVLYQNYKLEISSTENCFDSPLLFFKFLKNLKNRLI